MDVVRPSLPGLSQADAVHAIKANWVEFYRYLGRAPGAELSEGPHLAWTLTGIPDPFLNVVFRTNLPPREPGAVVDEALAHFRARRIPTVTWLTDAPEVGELLGSRGLIFSDGALGMTANLTALPEVPLPPRFSIVDVEDRAAFRSWVHVMRIGFGTPEGAEPALLDVVAAIGSGPDMRTYLGVLDGEPVATSQLFLGAGVAGIYQVTCLPEARGRGIGAAITLAPLREARRLGYSMAILQASDLGAPVYRRLGFQDVGRLNEYRFTSH